jgi:hypothetical protein
MTTATAAVCWFVCLLFVDQTNSSSLIQPQKTEHPSKCLSFDPKTRLLPTTVIHNSHSTINNSNNKQQAITTTANNKQ